MLINMYISKFKIIKNLNNIKKINENIICVLKDDAYGLGIKNILPILMEQNIQKIAVAFISEALNAYEIMKKHNKIVEIMTLNYVEKERLEEAIEKNIEITVYSIQQLIEYVDYMKSIDRNLNDLKIHLKLNTGMNRLGFDEDELDQLINIILNEKLSIKSIFTHIASAENIIFTENQLNKFDRMLNILKLKNIQFEYTHAQASPLLFEYDKKYNYDYARIGMAIYGLQPLKKKSELENPITLITKIVHIRDVIKGEKVSYGNKKIDKDIKIAVVPIGYAHGLQKQIENSKSYVLIRGEKAYITGEICMDMILVDVSDIKDVSLNDEVVILGNQVSESITIKMMAEWANTIQDDIITKLDKSITRIVI